MMCMLQMTRDMSADLLLHEERPGHKSTWCPSHHLIFSAYRGAC